MGCSQSRSGRSAWLAGRLRSADAASVSSENVDSPPQSFAAAGTPPDELALIAAMRLAREHSPLQLVVLALIEGFIAGRTMGK
jgi:hypothetical protein